MKKVLAIGCIGAFLLLAGCGQDSDSKSETSKNEKKTEAKKETTTNTVKKETETKQTNNVKEKVAQEVQKEEASVISSVEDAQFIFYNQDFVTSEAKDLEKALNGVKETNGNYVISVEKKDGTAEYTLSKNGELSFINDNGAKTPIEDGVALEALAGVKALEDHFKDRGDLSVNFDHVDNLKLVFHVFQNNTKDNFTVTYDWVTYDTETKKFTSEVKNSEDYSDVVVK